jgi:membrane protein
MTESFAAAGSLVVLLAWVYYAAQIFLLGAEFTKVYADEHGSKAAQKAVTATKQTAVVGVPVEAPAMKGAVADGKLVETAASKARAEPQEDPATQGPVFKAADVGLHAALAGLITEVIALVAVTAAGAFVHNKRKKLQKQYRWR